MEVSLESGGGACFCFCLQPCCPPEVEQTAQKDRKKGGPGDGEETSVKEMHPCEEKEFRNSSFSDFV